jgi:hypothetical protein
MTNYTMWVIKSRRREKIMLVPSAVSVLKDLGIQLDPESLVPPWTVSHHQKGKIVCPSTRIILVVQQTMFVHHWKRRPKMLQSHSNVNLRGEIMWKERPSTPMNILVILAVAIETSLVLTINLIDIYIISYNIRYKWLNTYKVYR